MAKWKKFKVSKKQVLVAVGVVVLLAAALGAGLAVRWLQGSVAETAKPYSPSSEKLPPTISDAQNLAASGKVSESNQKLQAALGQSDVSNDDKYQLLLQIGVNDSNQNQYQQALDYFKQAEAVKSTYTTSHLIAEQAEALGDKPTAIAYYKKTITQLDTASPGYAASKEDYQNRIVALGGQP